MWYNKRRFLLVVILLICLLQGVFLLLYVLSNGLDSNTPPQPPPAVHVATPSVTSHQIPQAVDNQLSALALHSQETHNTPEHDINRSGVDLKVSTHSPRVQSVTRKFGNARKIHRVTSHPRCTDSACSSILAYLSLQCYIYCEGLARLRTQVASEDIPKRCQFRESMGRVPVALVSTPGSGNTWVRGLLEMATGICTGSIYCDVPLRNKGFVGEYVQDGSVLVVKTHTSDYQWKDTLLKKRNEMDTLYSSAILLVRNPFHTFVAERHRTILLEKAEQAALKLDKLHGVGNVRNSDSSHVRAIDKEEAFGNSSDWKKFAHNIGKRWQKTIIEWSTSNHSVLVVRYEDLQADSFLQVTRMLDFLGHSYNATDLAAKLRGGYTDFHRNHTDNYEHYSEDQKRELNAMIMDTISVLQAHHLDHLFKIREYVVPV